jgi:hypothetical protein
MDMCVHVHESRRTDCEALQTVFLASRYRHWQRFLPFFVLLRAQQRSKKSGWSPFATKRRPPSPPPEPLFDSNPDAAVLAEALRGAIGAKPRRAPNDKHY